MPTTLLKTIYVLLLTALLLACGGGGGDRAPGIESGPSEPGQPITPNPPVLPSDQVAAGDLSASDSVVGSVGAISVNSPPTIAFTLTVNGVQTVAGLTTSQVRFSLARLVANSGSAVGQHWESYIERNEDPVCRSSGDVSNSQNACTTFTSNTDPGSIVQSDLKVNDPVATGKVVVAQANTENNGTLTAGSDGEWLYQYSTDPGDPATLNEVHRACIQFSLNAPVDNVCVDFVPALLADSGTAVLGSSLHPQFYDSYSGRQIATATTCNSCHDKLALHGGGRTEIEYCVTCHNPNTADANSGHVLDLAAMVHKLHNGRNLPQWVDDGVAYKIWGYRNSEHDYSHTSYPQPVTNCSRCHAGAEDVEFATAQGLPAPEADLTADGHSWVTNPTLLACGSCHEKLLDGLKLDGTATSYDHSAFTNESNCAGCHRDGGATAPRDLQADQAHRNLLTEEGREHVLTIASISNAGVGQTPLIDITVSDGAGLIDLKDSNAFCSNAVFDVRIAWDGAGEFLNQDGSGVGASSPRIRGSVSPAGLTALGGNLFRLDGALLSNTTTIPAGVDSIAVMIDTRYPAPDAADVACAGSDTVRLDGVVKYAATDAGTATERREIVEVSRCASCHGRYVSDTHSTRGVNNPLVCASCHNPNRKTSGSSHDLSVTVHGVHASAMRTSAFKGSWDTERLQFPGDLSDCGICHVSDSYSLPLPLTREPVLSETGVYTTPIAAVCSSCHDGTLAKAHMETQGGALFNDSYANAAAVTETCSVCHGQGASADVETVHNR